MHARARRTQKERSEETQSRLLTAALEVLVERGYTGLSTVEVCKRAGVSRGAQLHHYPTKAELVAASVEHVFDLRQEEFRKLFEGRLDSVGAQVESALEALWQIYSGPVLYAWMELVIASRTDASLHPHVAAVNDRFFVEARRTLCGILGRDPDVDDPRFTATTRLVLSVFDGLAFSRIVDDDKEQVRGALRTLQPFLETWFIQLMEEDA